MLCSSEIFSDVESLDAERVYHSSLLSRSGYKLKQISSLFGNVQDNQQVRFYQKDLVR